jgi:surface polysaccharide O-acyltransferase-like enzyme
MQTRKRRRIGSVDYLGLGLTNIMNKRDLDLNKESTNEEQPIPADIVRAVAVVLVILLHASNESYSGLTLSAFEGNLYWWVTTIYNSLARPAVPLFILLTGALLLRPIKINEPIRVFLKKRFTRIGLAFVFWGVVYFVWSYFVHHQALTFDYVVRGILTGPYYHFWFLYLIAGLYLVTPILRVIVTFGELKLLRYFLILWLLGVSFLPLFQLITGYTLNPNVFIIGGWMGYFILGAYVQKFKLRSSILFGLLLLGYFSTIFGVWLTFSPFHYAGQFYFFLDSLTLNVILASVALFMMLNKFPAQWPGSNHPVLNRVILELSHNSLPIYLFQLIILESLQMGFFGFRISLMTINPILEIPLITVVALFITLGLVLLMRRVPVLKKLIG